jgi:NDP-sugar pyrophosphorylase family protein
MWERKPLLSSSTYIHVGRNCSIDPTAILQGPLFIGDNVTIGPGCVVTQCLLGNNVTLTHSNHLHMSVLSDNCFLPWGASAYFTAFMEDSISGQNATLEMSLIGRNSYIGSGTVLTNFNLLPVPIKTWQESMLTELNMPVLGVCVGHNCRLGAGLVVYPGRMIESDVVLVAAPNRRVIVKNISYEESDHHAIFTSTDLHPRRYPRDGEVARSGGGR